MILSFVVEVKRFNLLGKYHIKHLYWLPFACEPVDEEVKPHISEDHDIVFVGSYYPNREEILKQLTGFNFRNMGTRLG